MSRQFKGLVKRFTKKQAELSQRIKDDLAEGIDPDYASVKDLHIAVSYWADVATVNAQNAVQSKQEMSLVVSGLGLIECAVGSFAKRMSDKVKK